MARATTPQAVEVDEETTAVETAASPAVVEEAPASAVEEVEVAPATKSYTATNTWTAYYGSMRYDFIEGKKYNLPADANDWFTK